MAIRKMPRSSIIAATILIAAMMLWTIIGFTVDRYRASHQSSVLDSALVAQAALFEAELVDVDTFTHNSFHSTKFYPTAQFDNRAMQPEAFDFNPNTADSATLARLGLGRFAPHNIIAYRTRGGKFRKIEDLKRIYSIDTARVEALRQHVQFTNDDTLPARPKKDFFSFNINTITDSTLATFPGIGAARARAIVAHRSALGGFVHPRQLDEIEQLDDSVKAHLVQHATFDTTKIRKIQVNFASVANLRRHPYITFQQARAIVDLRWNGTNKGTLTPDVFATISVFTPTQFEQLMPYLDFTTEWTKQKEANK